MSSVSPSLIVKKSPSGGKPKSFAMAIESSKKTIARSTAPTTTASGTTTVKTPRGRPKRKETLVAMYQSQLSENTMGIKIRLKKSLEPPISAALSSSSGAGGGGTTKKKSINSASSVLGSPTTASVAAGTSKQTRKRQRKSKHKDTSDSDDSDYDKRRKNNNTATEKHRNRKQTTNTATDYAEPNEQSQWGNVIPEHVLLKIFEEAVSQYGTLPIMVNVGRVCSLWRRVSLTPHLWHTLDLSTWTKDRSEINLKQIIGTHLRWCKDVNLGRLRCCKDVNFNRSYFIV